MDVLLLPPLLSVSILMMMMMQVSFIVIQNDKYIYYFSVGNFENCNILVTNCQTGRKRSHTANINVPAHKKISSGSYID